MEFGVLGPLRVEGAAGTVEIPGAKERLLLARLIAAHGQVVPRSALIDALWDGAPPMSAAKSLQSFVSRLRSAFAPHCGGRPLVATEGAGYRLTIDSGQVDAERFVRLANQGRATLAEGRAANAHHTLVAALALWRGPAYSDFQDADFAVVEAARLEERRLAATEDLLSALVELGRAAEAVPELEALVRTHPMRERAWELQVTALYRAGRQGDALAAYDRARVLLAETLGVDPGPSLRGTHARVLAQDPELSTVGDSSGLPAALPLAPKPPGLVGRDRELQRLRQLWHSALSGQVTTVLIRGPQGAGATALAAELATELARDGAHVAYLSSDCREPANMPTDSRPVIVVADHAVPAWTSTRPHLTLHLTSPHTPADGDAEIIDLSPLDRDAVSRIVAAYLPVDEIGQITDRVLATSSGWPGEVHDLARDIAHDRAVQHVRDAASMARTLSTDLLAVREELADGVAALRSDVARVPTSPGACPWRGLEAYHVEDARWYAGRDRLIAEILARLTTSRLVALVGGSGSGKSSALRAGVLAALQQDVLPGSAGWRTVLLRPGAHPLAELARHALGPNDDDLIARLLDCGGKGRTIVAIDQFEEVWTECADETERARFLALLTDLATDPASEVTVVLAVRADFAASLAAHDRLRTLVGDGAVFVGPMTSAEVRRVIERPASAAGLLLDDGLAETIVSDAGTDPGLLPLLSTALAQLWERRNGRQLGYAAYLALGGLDGAIATLAENAYGELSLDEQRTAQTLLLRLIGPGDGDTVTRRRVPLAEIQALPDPIVGTVLDRLIRARLLTRSEGSVEVAHEALFREWPRLRGWLAEDAAGHALLRRLAVAATDWDTEGREPSMLWSGARLTAALDIAVLRPAELTQVEYDFLEAGNQLAHAARRAAEERAADSARANRRLRTLIAGISVLLLVATAAGALALRAQREASVANSIADARRLASAALNIEEPDLALLAAVEATRQQPDVDTYGALLTVLSRQPSVVHRVRTPDTIGRLKISPDGSRVFLTEHGGRIRTLDAETGEQLWTAAIPGGTLVHDLAPSPDGTQLILTLWPGESPPSGGMVSFDTHDGTVQWATLSDAIAAAVPDSDPTPRAGRFIDGHYVTETGSHVLTIDPSTGEVLGSVRIWPEAVEVSGRSLVWPDGRVSLSLDLGFLRSVVLDPARPNTPPAELDGLPMAISPDGSECLVISEDENGALHARLINSSTYEDLTDSVRLEGTVWSVSWTADSQQILLGIDDVVQLLDPNTMTLGNHFSGHSAAVMGLGTAGASHDLLWSAGRDGTAVAFDLAGTRTVITRRASEPTAYLGRSAPAAGLGVHLRHGLGQGPHTAVLTEIPSGRTLGALVPDTSSVKDGGDSQSIMDQAGTVAIDDHGHWALVGLERVHHSTGPEQDQGLIAVFDPATRRQTALIELPWPARGIAATADRAFVHGTGGFLVIDLTTNDIAAQPTELPPAPWVEMISGAEISPAGDLVAFGRGSEVVVVELVTGKVLRSIWADHESAAGQHADGENPAVVLALDWSADGATVVTGTNKGWLGFWSAKTGKPVAPPRLLSGGWMIDIETSPDGATLAAANREGDVMLWDAATWRPFGLPIIEEGPWVWPVFSADSRDLTLFVEDQEAVEMSVDPQSWIAAACSAAGRDLTPEERQILSPDAKNRSPTCPQ